MTRAVVFDLDGTLVDGDAFGSFLARSWRNPFRCAFAVVTAPAWLPLWLHPAGRTRGELLLIWSATVGRSPSGFRRALHRHAAAHVGAGRIPVVLDRLDGHRRAGDDVVVATACAEPLARAVCAELGITGVRLVASPFEHRRWRPPRALALRGALKVRALERAGVEFPVAHAYADDARDLPLLRLAERAHLVRPGPAAERAVLAALGEVEVLR